MSPGEARKARGLRARVTCGDFTWSTGERPVGVVEGVQERIGAATVQWLNGRETVGVVALDALVVA